MFIFHKQYIKQCAKEFLKCSIHQILLCYMLRNNLNHTEGTGLTIVNRQCIEMTGIMKQILVFLGLIESPTKHRTFMAHDENLLVV